MRDVPANLLYSKILQLFISAPDITRLDGIYSQYLLPLNQKGYYSTICGFDDKTIGARYFPLPSFHVEIPTSPFHDTIPPSPIRDLQVFYNKPQTHAEISGPSMFLPNNFNYRIYMNIFLPLIVSPFNSLRGNYSINEVKNCHNAETL